MTTLDWLIVVFAALGAISGAMRGFVAGALSLAGFVGGAFAGARLAPLLLSGGSESPYAPLFALIGALVLGIALAGLLQGVGGAVMGGVRIPVARTVDAALGGLLGAAIALTLVWVAGAAALHTPGADSLRTDVQRSSILQALNDALPPSGPILRALARFDPLPVIAGPAPAGIEPPSQEALSRPGVRAAVDGTVRVLAAACGLGISGSGWIARRGVIVTNAHVVAGTEGDVSVQLRGTGDEARRARRLLRPARRHRDPRGAAGRGLTAADRRRSAVRHRRRDPRLSGERPVRLPRRAHRSDPAGLLAGHLRERADPAHDDLDPRPDTSWELRRARRRQGGARPRDRVRLGRGHIRQRRLRRAERARPLGAGARGSRIAERFDRRVHGLSGRAWRSVRAAAGQATAMVGRVDDGEGALHAARARRRPSRPGGAARSPASPWSRSSPAC